MSNKFELFLGCLGNGTTVCNKAVLENGDYKTIAHISDHGVIKYYVEESSIPDNALKTIKRVANNSRENFMETWNKKDYLQKYEYMMNIPTIGCGLNAIERTDREHKELPIKDRVTLMERVFFETHM